MCSNCFARQAMQTSGEPNKWFGLVQHVIQPLAQELGFCYQGVCTFYATYMPSVTKVSRAFAAAIYCLKST